MSTKRYEDSGTSSGRSIPTGNLDLRALMDAAEAIASAQGLTQLVHTMMSFVMANAGAERVYLLTKQGEDWRVEARADAGASGVQVGLRHILADENDIAAAIVHHVARTRSTVLLDDAVSAGQFVQDPVIQRCQARSLLALPLIHQGNLIAILYLENNLAPAVFTPARVQLLALLSGQMAIAIEQNRLHDHLEAEIAARTQALSSAEAQIRTLFENSQIGIGLTTPEGKILAANNALLQMTGFVEAEILQQNVIDFYVNPEQRADLLARLSTSDSVNDYGVKLKHKNGSTFFAKMNVSKVNQNGQQIILAMIEDVTDQVELTKQLHQEIDERKRAEEKYQAQITLVDSLLDVALDTVEIFDPSDMSYLKWNRTFNELTGYSDEEIVKMNPADDFFDEADLPKVDAAVEEALNTGEVSVIATLLTKDGSRVPMEYTGSVTTDPAGNPLHFIAIGRNITDRKQAEMQLAQSAANAERIRLARDLHDSVTQSLFTSTLFAQAGRKQIQSGNVEGAEHYLDRILQISHQASKEMRLFIYELLPDNLSEFGLIEAIQRRIDMIEKRVGIDVHFTADDMSNTPASINEALYRIVQEALNNSLKHAEADQVIIRICRASRQISLRIEDNGVGFDLDEARAGAGIGLRSMSERAAQLNSELRIDSAPQQGTKISIIVDGAS